MYTGVDPGVPVSVFEEKGYESMPFQGGTVYGHAEIDLSKNVWFENRYAVVLDDGVLIYADSDEAVQSYATWFETGSESLADSDVLAEQLQSLEPDVMTRFWMEGDALNLTGALINPITTTDQYAEVEDLQAEEFELFGSMPPVQAFSWGCDAVIVFPNLRDPDAEPPALAEGYDDPGSHLYLMFGSDDDALLAAEIIEWRFENMPSWQDPETSLRERLEPFPIEQSDTQDGVLMQQFGSATAVRDLYHMVLQQDLSVYGW